MLCRRLARISWPIVFLLAFSACKGGGIDSPAEYRSATQKVVVTKVKVIQAAKEARQAGDPMILGRAFENLVPAVKQLKAAAHAIEIGDPSLVPIHQQLLASVDGYADTIVGMNPTIMSTVLKDSKIKMRDILKVFEESFAAWEQQLGAF